MEIRIEGAIVSDSIKWLYDWFDEPATCPKDVMGSLPEDPNEPVVVWINSPGGDMNAGGVIYDMLLNRRGDVTVKITGQAASAGSLIAMAGTKVLISPMGMMFVHRVSTYAEGNAGDLEKAVNLLNEADEACVNAYEMKTGLPRDEILAMMREDTWMSAARAVELGFADEVMFQDKSSESFAGLAASAVAMITPDQLTMRAQALLALEKQRF